MKLQISVRELLFIVFVAGVGLAGLLQKTVSWEAREQHEYLNDEMLVR